MLKKVEPCVANCVLLLLVLPFCLQFLICYSNIESQEEEEEFFSELTGIKRIVPITKEGKGDDVYEENINVTLYRYTDTLLITYDSQMLFSDWFSYTISILL